MIAPHVGRVVLFVPREDTFGQFGFYLQAGKPHAALVTAVHGDRCVNLAVFDANGKTFGRTSVTLRQPGDEAPPHGDYCEWMPYQIGQAAKADELQQALAAKG